jgi:hypothetical protein
MLVKLFGYTALIELILILIGIIFFLIYRGTVLGKLASKDKEIFNLKTKMLEYHSFAQTLISNLELLKYYENVDKTTRLQIEQITENINAFIPIANEFKKWLEAREKEEKDIPKKEKK